MKRLSTAIKNRLEQINRPEPTIVIHKGEDLFFSDTGEQGSVAKIYVKFSVLFRENQLAQLKGAPLSVFICLALHIEEKGTCYPSISLISKETGYNRDTIFDALKKLEFMGYIARKQYSDTKSKKFLSNVYQLFPRSVNFEARNRGGK